MNNHLIYKLSWPNGYYYIGRTKNLEYRLKAHIYNCKKNKKNGQFQYVYNKHGIWDKVEILTEGFSAYAIVFVEQAYLNNHLNTKKCVNSSPSADGGSGNSGKKHTTATKTLMSNVRKGMKLTEEHKINLSKSKKNYWANPENRQQKSREMKKHYEDPKNRDRQREVTIEAMARPEVIEKCKRGTAKRWADPKAVERHKKGQAKRWADPIKREQHRKSQAKRWAKYRAKKKAKE